MSKWGKEVSLLMCFEEFDGCVVAKFFNESSEKHVNTKEFWEMLKAACDFHLKRVAEAKDV